MNESVRLPAGAGASLRLRVPPDPRYGHYVRERVVNFAATHQVAQLDAEQFVAAIAEALANAIEHSGATDTIEIAVWFAADDQLLATIVDRGVGFSGAEQMDDPQLPAALAERGRGLPLMKKFTDMLTVRSMPGKGTSVVLGRYVSRMRRGSGSRAVLG